MNDTELKECYGTMFPDALHFIPNKAKSGKVFKFKVESVGGLGAGSNRNIEMDMDEWRDCLRCPAFDHCYKLCMAQMELECAIASQ